MRALVTGADGFVGRWLVRHLEEAGDEVWQACGLNPGPGAPGVRLDITDAAVVERVVRDASPQAVYHLAAIAFGPEAAAHIRAATAVTIGGTVNLLEACRAQPDPPLVMIPSSAEVYGAAGGDPLDEATPIDPVNLYGATKAAQEAFSMAYHRAGLVRVVVARAFNHIGPGQSESFVVPGFAAQLAEVARGRAAPVLRVGNLDAERDFTDVRDVVSAYRLLVDGGKVGQPFNVASGRSVAIRRILDSLIALSGIEVRVVVDPARLRAVDRPRVVGSSARLREATGWSPSIELGRTLADVWEDALARHRGGD